MDSDRLKKRKLAELHLSYGSCDMSKNYLLIFAENRSYFLSAEAMIMVPEYYQCFSANKTQELRDAWDNLHTEYWRYSYPQDGAYQILDGAQWSLSVRNENGFWISYDGDNYYPENWFGLLDMFGISHDCEDDDNDEDDIDKDEQERNPNEVIYCSVSFNKGGSAYTYLTEDESVSVGDRVVVPVGDDNAERIGIVDTIDYYLPEDVPYPLDKVKKIIRTDSCVDWRRCKMVELCNYKRNGIAVYVDAHIKDGGLVISGQDLGSNVENLLGAYEYEYFYSLTPTNTTKLYHLLKADSKLDIELLDLMKLYFSDVDGCKNFREFCEIHNIPFDFSNYF